MVRSNNYGWSIRRQSLGQTALVFRNVGPNAGEAFQSLRIRGTVIEDDGADDSASIGRESDENFDIRDLLLDETD